eukprot:12921969-Prorocentrum_lima.AAC.1
MRTHEKGPRQLLLMSTRNPMQQTEGPGVTNDEGHDGSQQGVLEGGTYHEPCNDFKLPTGPATRLS